MYNGVMENLRKFIDMTLNTRITPIAYLIAALGIIRGLAYTVFQNAEGVTNTILYKVGPIIPLTLWGAIVLASSIILLYGMVSKTTELVQAGAMGMFLTWVLTAITYGVNGYIPYLMPTAVVYALIYGYFFLAASLGRLWDYTPNREEDQ
jgi:uncharacterized membrane protein